MEAAGVLSVAFGLGLLLHASQAAFFTAINGHIKTLFLHRRRLVLLSFLLSVSIFSITQFATLLLLEDASCGVAVRFTLFFDQAARVSALALIIWKVCDEAGARAEAVMWVSVIGLRILMGGIIVGFTGMTFMPVCFPEPIHIVMGIIHTTFDGCVWVVLGCRIVQIWMLFVEQGRRGNGGGKSQGYGLFLIVLGFSGWTIASFPYMMSVGDSIFVRMVPYILTLALSLGVLGCFPSIVFSVPIGKTEGSYKLRQFSSTSPPRRGRSASSPTFNPADMEANKFQTYAVGSFDKNYSGVRNSQMFRSILGAPIVHPGTALPWSLDTDAPDITRPKPAKAPENRRPSGASHAGKASISGPIGPLVRNMSFDRAETTTVGQLQSSNSFGKMKTVDLKTAAEAERQRIDAAFEREQEKKRLGEVAPEVATPSTVRSTSVKRKPVIPQLPSGPAPFRVSAINELRGVRESEYSSPSSLGRSVSAAGAGDSRRTSRRTSSLSDDNTTQYTSRSHAPYILAPGLPRIPQLERLEGGAKVMFVNQIVYDDPALVRSLMGKTDVALTTSRYSRSTGTTVRRSPSSATKQHPGMLTPTGEVDEPIPSSNPVLVMDRPRNVKSELERGIFPPNRDSGMVAEMRYKRKHLTVAMGNTSSRATMHPISRHSLQHVVKKRSPKEIIFPIHLSRANSARKPAPPPITIVPAMIFSPQIIQHAPTPDLVDTPENIPSPERAISEKSEKHMVSKQQDVDEVEDKKIAYETARAWIDSVSAVSGTTRSPYSDGTPVPLLSIAYDPSSGTKLRMNLISLTLSPKTKEDEGEFTDIEIDSGSESGEYEDEDEGSDEQTQSEADEMIMSGGEGYSTEEESYEEDYFTESDEERRYPNDGVVISDVEDGTTYDKIALAERKLNAKMNTLTVPALDDPNHFQIGDRIPTFSKSRRKYGSRRKPPPSPIAFLMRQRHESQIQARLLLFSGGQNVTSLESLMDRLPTKNKRDTQASYMSDGQSSLLARLEAEVGQQENQWMGMRQDLDSKRSSVISSTYSPVRGLARLSQNLGQRRSLLAMLNSGIDRRLSNAQATSTSVMAQSSLSDVSSGQQQLAEAQMEYLAQAPSFSRKIGESPLRPISILESQHTPISVISESEVDHSEVESPVSLHGDAQRESFYSNDISVVVMEVDEQYEDEDFEDYEVEEYEEEEEEYGEDGIHITVYSPSIESPSIQEPPIQVCYSSTTEVLPKSPISLLWNSRTMQEGASETNQLWVYHPLSPETTFVFPPAVDLRPKQRISTAPITKSTSNLWSKPRLSHYAPSTGLWCPKEFRTKSAIIASFPVARRTKNLAKRVTFVEELVTVEPTGFLGKLKMLWDAPKRSSQSAPKMQLQRVKTKENLFDPIVVKYANKMLPPLPIQKDEVNAQDTARGALWTKGENIAKKYNSAPLWTPALIVPTPEEQVVFVKDTLEIRTKPRTAALPALESQRLWDTGKPAVSTTLWTKPLDARYLWPTGPSSAPISRDCLWPSAAALPLEIELGPQNSHSYGEIVVLASLESTELWKEVVVELQAEEVVGLWFDKSVRTQDQCVQEPAPTSRFDSLLWPTAVSPPVFYLPGETPFIRYSRPSATTTLVTLTSHELWKPCTVVAVQGLWSPPAKESALWPQGRRSRTPEVVKSLWPSAVSLPSEVELALHGSGSYKETVLASLESTELWKAVVIETQTEVAGLWFDRYARAQSQEPVTTPTSDSLLWPTAVSPSALYLAVETRSIRYSRPSATTSLATLTSHELWKSFTVVAVQGLWSPPAKESALWPQGRRSRTPEVVKSLWPSAVSLPSEVELALHGSGYYKETVLALLESTELWKAVVIETQTEVAGLWFDKYARAQSQEPMTTPTSGSFLWPTAVSPSVLYLVVETPSIRYSRPSATTSLATLTSYELWNPRAAVAANSLWSPPTKKSALWPQGQLSRAAPLVSKSLWPSAVLLPSKIELILRGSGSYKEAALASLESTELWKAVVVEIQTEVAGLWFDKSVRAQSQGPMTSSSLLWPTAVSLPALYPAVETLSIRYSRPSVSTTALATLTSHELWNPRAAVAANTLWLPPTKRSALWPQGQLSRAAPLVSKSLWPAAALLPSEIELGLHGSGSARKTVALSSLESTELWKAVVVEQQVEEVTGLWFDKSAHPQSQSQYIEELVATPKSDSFLWPTAASLPALYLTEDIPPIRHTRLANLATLISRELWRPWTAATTTTLWSPPSKKSALWPQGQLSGPTSAAPKSLWPSAAPLPLEIELGFRGPSSYRGTAALASLESAELWKVSVVEISEEMTGLWFDKSIHIQPQYTEEPMVITFNSLLWPATASLPAPSLTEETLSVRYTRPATANLATLASCELWKPWTAAAATALWSPPSKKSALWPQGQLSEPAPAVLKSLWPSAAPLPLEIELGLRGPSSYRGTATLASLESAELWKVSVVEISEEMTGLWFDKSIHIQPQYTEEPVVITFNSLLWPATASLPAPSLTEETLSVRYTRPATANLATLTSCELWKPWTAAAATALWSPPSKKSALWPQGQLSEPAPAVLKSLWPSATPLPFEIELGFHGPSSYRETAALASLESTELWKTVAIELQPEEATGLWLSKSIHTQSQYIEETIVITSNSLLWPTAASLPAFYLTEDTISIRYNQPATANLVALTSCELWKPWTVATPAALWSPPSKQSALWPQGQLSGPASAAPKSLWPSATPLPFEIELGLRGPSSYRETAALASLESTELWKTVAIELQPEEATGLWLNKSIYTQSQYIEETIVITSNSLLWPTAASLPAFYLTEDTISIRYNQPATANLVALTSCELWKPWTVATPAALWSPPSKQSALWPQGQLSEPTSAVLMSLWPSAAPLPFEFALRGPGSYRETASLASLESTELWKAVTIELQPEEETGLWFDKSVHFQSHCIEEPVFTPTFDSLLWPATASLPTSYLTGEKASIRYTRSATANLATLTSRELWKPWTATTPALWSPIKQGALWPQGQLSRVAIGALWPSAAALRLEIEVSTVRSRSPIVTLPGLKSTELWNNCQQRAGENRVPALWTAPECRSGLWPEGKVQEKVIGNLWPAARSMPVEYQTFGEVSVRSKAKPVALAKLKSTGLWMPVRILKTTTSAFVEANIMEEIQKTAITPAIVEVDIMEEIQKTAITPAIVEVDIIEMIQEEQLADSMLWVKKQNAPIAAAGYLWPSATQLPLSFSLPSTTIQSRFTTATLPTLQSTHLWSSKIATQATLWTRSIKKNGLWPHGKSDKAAGSLWPSAPSLAVSDLARPMLVARPRNLAASAKQIQSLALWSPEPETKARLWAAPAIENGLWPHGRSAVPTNLWPSALSLPTMSRQDVHNFRTETMSLVSLESDRLWCAASKGPVRPQLWIPEVKMTGLWPRGEIKKEVVVMGGLWPSAGVLPKTDVVAIVHARSTRGAVVELESGELWKLCIITPALWIQSATKESGLWPNGIVDTTSSKIDLWCAPDSGAIVRRSNLMLEMGGEERIARKRDMLSAVNAVSGALWEERQMGLELPGWLLRTQDIEAVDSLPIPNLFDTTKSEVEIESQQIIAPVTPSLWARSPPASDIRLDSALWQSKAANTTSPTEAPRVRLSTRRKTFRPDTSRLLPAAAGKLWSSSLLPEARQRTWRQAPQEGLWNADGTTATLSQINARSQKICLLWGRHSREVFAHLALTSRYSKRKAPPPGSKSATGPLWAPTASPGVVSGAKFPGFHGLWSPRTLPVIRPAPTHLLLLWQKYDKPQLVTPVAILASPVPSRSLKLNKRTPPLYLASQQAAGPMWVASKSVRPRELWRPLPKSGTRENLLWSFSVDTTPTLKKSASSSSETKLWPKLDSTPNSFFSTISKQSIRTTRKTENTAIISMEGPLWKSSPVTTPTKPNLWRKKEETMGLWSVNGITMTPPPSPETATYLWGKNPGATAPIFVGLSQESLRSRREFATKSFSAPPDGLWRKQVIEPVIERPSMGLWGTVAEPAQIAVPEIQVKTIQLWQKDNTAAPIFTNIPVESYRFKRDNSTIALPVFKGSMWKKQVALPKKPELWKPAPKTTHLWDSNSGTKSLAQILLEKKANAIKKPLWTKDQASRTTEKTPQRSPLATFRISNNITLPKASGDLWKPKTAKKQIPQLWTPPKPVVKAPKPVGTLLWAKGHTSRTTDAVPERTKVAYRFSDKPLPIMSGSLWKPKSPVKKISLWKRPIRTVATYPRTGVPTPLWSKELASRTTTARPERSTFVPKKKEVSTTLRKATGLLWQPKAATPLKELWKVPTKPVVSKPPQASPLWSKHSASRTTTATPVRTTVPKRLVDSPLSTVSGTLWHQKPAEGPKGLWKRAIKTVATYRRTSSPALLWSKELASRTTTARPSRGPFVPKPNTKSHILPAATGKLWQPEPATTQPLTLWTHNSTAPSSGLWDAKGRTPSLAEIKNRLGTQRDPLWQRRSVLTSKVASTTIKPAAPVHKKLRINSRPNGPADGTLWQPATTTVLADSVTMWLTRSSRSSSIDEAFLSPNLSRASTMSDMSECEDSPPSTGADDFAPGISRIHSTKASISSVAGDLLWQRTVEIAAAEKKKELALWTGEETSVGRSVLVAERPMRIPLQAKGAGELKVFDKSHELWKPSGEMDEKLLYDSSSEEDFHDAESHDTEFDFHDAESQHSEKSKYMDFDYAEGKRQKSTSTEEGLSGVNEPVKPAAVECLWSRCAT